MRHPLSRLTRELLIAVAVIAGIGALILITTSVGWRPPSPWGYFAVAVTTVAVFVAGRRWPSIVLYAVSGLQMLLAVATDSYFIAPLVFLIAPLYLAAFYAISLGEKPRTAIVVFAAVSILIVLPIVFIARVVAESGGALSPWELFELSDWSNMVLLLGGTALTSILGISVRRQRITVDLLRRRTRELEELRSLETQRVVENTRSMLAREIHDEVAHHVAALVITSNAGLALTNDHPERLPGVMKDLAQGGKEALGALRRIVRVLQVRADGFDPHRPTDVASGLDEIAVRVGRAGLAVHSDVTGDDTLSAAQRTAVLLITQEALTNVLLHSASREAAVQVNIAPAHVVLTVLDNGPAADRFPDLPHGGTGMNSMGDRARALGGNIVAGPSGVAGWQVRAEFAREGTS